MIPLAQIEHRAEGRARLRIPLRRRDPAYFERVCQQLARLDGVTAVHCNARTAGVLIEWQGAEPDFASYATKHELFQPVYEDQPADLRTAVARSLSRLNRDVAKISRGRLDNRAIGFVSLAAFAGVQFLRGSILPPAMTLVIHALELIDRHNAQPDQRQDVSPE